MNQNFWLFLEFGSVLAPQCFQPYKSNSKQITNLYEFTSKWCQGELLNLDYLLKLNEFAGYNIFKL